MDMGQAQGNETTTIAVYEQTSPAVVTLSVGAGSGSGSIIGAQGLVVTNEHVVSFDPTQGIRVQTMAGGIYEGQVVAVDVVNDLALVQIISGEVFPTVRLAGPGMTRVGQQVFAIGSPFGLTGTLSTGILSRMAPNGDLQTSVMINLGSSGGPLLNSRGELIGVNKEFVQSADGGNVGISFATSVDRVWELVEHGFNAPQRADIPTFGGHRLGIVVEVETLVVRQVDPGSVAEWHGIQV
ncbi:MAG: trypsin-like serine protease, partial [Spirulinaceae cyanobacterium SM2_1_0]|nr:trypsin-like serine protease [Spirulinaceae cyanobacterium SM2_1_0]